jgi:hypothetical protein
VARLPLRVRALECCDFAFSFCYLETLLTVVGTKPIFLT